MSDRRTARSVTPHSRGDRRLPPALLFGERPWNRGAIFVGLLGTLLFHFVVVFLTPRWDVAGPVDGEPATREIEVVLTPEEEAEPETPQYVETNRAAPENLPDRTNQFSARDQQAANEIEPEEMSTDRSPAREGREDLPFEKAFSGEQSPPLETLPAPEVSEVAETPPQAPEQTTPLAQNPLPGFEEDQGEEENIGSSVTEVAPNPQPIEESVEGEDDPREEQEAVAYVPEQAAERPQPAPRPRLPRAQPGPVTRQREGAAQLGYVGYDANASRFGEYMERMAEAVQQHWESKAANRVHETGTRVVVEFELTRDGTIENLMVRDSTSNSIGVLAVRAALEQGQPYGPWTEDMVTVFGDKETLTFTFYYW